MEDNIATECNRTVAATYGCKILQLHKYEVKHVHEESQIMSQNRRQFIGSLHKMFHF